MESLFRYIAPPSQCGYLQDQAWSLEYELVQTMSAAEYMTRMEGGWRRFGRMIFRPQCQACQACQPIRVIVNRFHLDRSQRRAIKTDIDIFDVRIGNPSVTKAKLELYDKYHAYQAVAKGWPDHPAKDAVNYASSFVDNPFPTQEWCYYLDGRLVGVGYADDLPGAMSAIYFFYDPEERELSIGTFNLLCMLNEAAQRGIPYLYLGYYVANCQSMQYKARFRPCEVRAPDGKWRLFRE